MIFDIHAHLLGLEEKRFNFLNPANVRRVPLKIVAKNLDLPIDIQESNGFDEKICEKISLWLENCTLDRVVFLAFDAVYDLNGEKNREQTGMIVDNDHVAKFARANEKALFGASVHPYRHDALDGLAHALELGACLVKFLPSAQGIEPDHPKCFPFYDFLALNKLPLLSHLGAEHMFANSDNSLNHPHRLKAALERGVTVIGAHCGAKLYPHERNQFSSWAEMAIEYDNFYGDISAFGLPMRNRALTIIKNNKKLTDRILYGSDFPVPTFPLIYGSQIGWRKAWRLRKINNPFDKAYMTFRETGLPDTVFSKAEQILRLDIA